jgi:hypothetical protein
MPAMCEKSLGFPTVNTNNESNNQKNQNETTDGDTTYYRGTEYCTGGILTS